MSHSAGCLFSKSPHSHALTCHSRVQSHNCVRWSGSRKYANAVPTERNAYRWHMHHTRGSEVPYAGWSSNRTPNDQQPCSTGVLRKYISLHRKKRWTMWIEIWMVNIWVTTPWTSMLKTTRYMLCGCGAKIKEAVCDSIAQCPSELSSPHTPTKSQIV